MNMSVEPSLSDHLQQRTQRGLSGIIKSENILGDLSKNGLHDRAVTSWPATGGKSIVVATQRIADWKPNGGRVVLSSIYASQDQGMSWSQPASVSSSADVKRIEASFVPNKFYLLAERDIYVTLNGQASRQTSRQAGKRTTYVVSSRPRSMNSLLRKKKPVKVRASSSMPCGHDAAMI